MNTTRRNQDCAITTPCTARPAAQTGSPSGRRRPVATSPAPVPPPVKPVTAPVTAPSCHPWDAPASIAARRAVFAAILAAFSVATLARVLDAVLTFLRIMVDLVERAEGSTNAADQEALSEAHDRMEAGYQPGDDVIADAVFACLLGSTAPNIVDNFAASPYVSEYSDAAIALVTAWLARVRTGDAGHGHTGSPAAMRAAVARGLEVPDASNASTDDAADWNDLRDALGTFTREHGALLYTNEPLARANVQLAHTVACLGSAGACAGDFLHVADALADVVAARAAMAAEGDARGAWRLDAVELMDVSTRLLARVTGAVRHAAVAETTHDDAGAVVKLSRAVFARE